MTDKLRWGFLGTARINNAILNALPASSRGEAYAVASRDSQRAEAYAREKNLPRWHAGYEHLLADPQVDVVYISLPNQLHAEWTLKALQAGKHVLCEKPFALTPAEVDAAFAAARQAGRVVAEAFMYRHHPQTLKVQDLTRNGSLGTLKLIRGSFSFVLAREGDVRLDPAMGGGSIWDVGCYPISYARTITGENPLEVFGWQVTGQTGIDETFVGQMRFANDIHAQFDCSFAIPFHAFMEIIGSEGTLNVPNPFKPGVDEKIYFTRGDKTETIKIKGQELYIGEVEDMADAILLRHAPRISLDDSRANVAVISSLLESARAGKPVSL